MSATSEKPVLKPRAIYPQKQSEEERLEELFRKLDVDGNGKIDIRDLSEALKDSKFGQQYAEVSHWARLLFWTRWPISPFSFFFCKSNSDFPHDSVLVFRDNLFSDNFAHRKCPTRANSRPLYTVSRKNSKNKWCLRWWDHTFSGHALRKLSWVICQEFMCFFLSLLVICGVPCERFYRYPSIITTYCYVCLYRHHQRKNKLIITTKAKSNTRVHWIF